MMTFDTDRLMHWVSLMALAVLVFFLLSSGAHAENTIPAASDEFVSLYTLLKTWCQGGLGKSIAIAFLIVGLGLGCIRGSIIAAVACLAAAVSLLVGPTIIDQLFSGVTG